MKNFLIKSNQYFDNIKEPYRFIIVFIVLLTLISLLTLEIIPSGLYVIVLFILFYWRISIFFIRK